MDPAAPGKPTREAASSSKPTPVQKPNLKKKKGKKKSKCGGQKDKLRRQKAQAVKSVIQKNLMDSSSSSSTSLDVPEQSVLDVCKNLVSLGSMSRSRQKRLRKRQQKRGSNNRFVLQEVAEEDPLAEDAADPPHTELAADARLAHLAASDCEEEADE